MFGETLDPAKAKRYSCDVLQIVGVPKYLLILGLTEAKGSAPRVIPVPIRRSHPRWCRSYPSDKGASVPGRDRNHRLSSLWLQAVSPKK